jgi:hypothetical protein
VVLLGATLLVHADDAEMVISLMPTLTDGFYHKGFALFHLKDYSGAVSTWLQTPAPGAAHTTSSRHAVTALKHHGRTCGDCTRLLLSVAGAGCCCSAASTTTNWSPCCDRGQCCLQAAAFSEGLALCPHDKILRQGFWDALSLLGQQQALQPPGLTQHQQQLANMLPIPAGASVPWS